MFYQKNIFCNNTQLTLISTSCMRRTYIWGFQNWLQETFGIEYSLRVQSPRWMRYCGARIRGLCILRWLVDFLFKSFCILLVLSKWTVVGLEVAKLVWKIQAMVHNGVIRYGFLGFLSRSMLVTSWVSWQFYLYVKLF